jgi:ribosomal RNA-processing protein 12
MIIDEEEGDAGQADSAVDVAGTAYRETITSVDGFTRGPNGRVKFNKDTKKRRRDNEDVDGDVEMGDREAGTGKSKKAKQRAEPKFGHEFKAKVCEHAVCYALA